MSTNYAIVVEGKSDKDLLKGFLKDVEIVTTNGSALSKDTISYIKSLAGKMKVIVLTDPDAPGKKIRDELNQSIPGLYNAYIPKEKCIKKNKVGIAESSKKDILEALANLIPSHRDNREASSLKMSDLYELKLVGYDNSAAIRSCIAYKLHIGECNGKTLLRQCLALGLNKEDLERLL